MNSKEVVIDTNFFMVPFQFNVDIITELENLLPSYKLTTPSFVINELKGLKRNNKGKICKRNPCSSPICVLCVQFG